MRLAEHVAKELRTLGMADEQVAAWLTDQPVRITDGLVVAMTGPRVTSLSGPFTYGDGGCRATSWRPGCGRRGLEAVVGCGSPVRGGNNDALALAEWADTPTGGLELHDGRGARCT